MARTARQSAIDAPKKDIKRPGLNSPSMQRVTTRSVKEKVLSIWKNDKELRKEYKKNAPKVGIAREPRELREYFLSDQGISTNMGVLGSPLFGYGKRYVATPEAIKNFGLEKKSSLENIYNEAFQDELQKIASGK